MSTCVSHAECALNEREGLLHSLVGQTTEANRSRVDWTATSHSESLFLSIISSSTASYRHPLPTRGPKVKDLERQRSAADHANCTRIKELNELIDDKECALRELEADVKQWKQRALKNDEVNTKQIKQLHGMKRGLQEKSKALSKKVNEVNQLTAERDELARQMAAKDAQLSLKNDQIVVKKEKIDEQGQELADMRRKSKMIGALLR